MKKVIQEKLERGDDDSKEDQSKLFTATRRIVMYHRLESLTFFWVHVSTLRHVVRIKYDRKHPLNLLVETVDAT